MPQEDLVAIAVVRRPHGIRGEVSAELLTDFPERFDGLRKVEVIRSDGNAVELEIESSRVRRNRVLLKFLGVDLVDEAEELRGAEICVPESDAVELEEDEFFDWELEGCRVVSTDGNEIGVVKAVFRAGENENLVVGASEGKDYLVPFVEAICVTVDTESKLIEVDLPDGLLDF